MITPSPGPTNNFLLRIHSMYQPLLARVCFAVCLTIVSLGAQAVPSFARQTNQECSTCHIGSFGPQLTPYGMKFKIGGYTETNVSDAPLIPLSGSSAWRTLACASWSSARNAVTAAIAPASPTSEPSACSRHHASMRCAMSTG